MHKLPYNENLTFGSKYAKMGYPSFTKARTKLKKFVCPPVGSVITLTTRYAESYIFATNKWRDTTYRNVEVLRPEKWFKTEEFKISSDDPKQPFRVINLANVIDIEDGDEAESDSTSCTIQVPGSKPGTFYDVTIQEGLATQCSCPGFSFRQRCRHLQAAVDTLSNTP